MRRDGAPTWWVSFLLIAVLALVGYGFILQPGKVLYSPHSDILAYHLGAKEVLWRSLEAGRGIPFWRADQMSGGPAFTSPNALYTYPLHALFYLLPPPAAVDWTMWIHLALGAVVFWELGRALGLGPWPRLLMAVAALFNFKVIIAVYAGWLSPLPSITFVPLLFAALFRVVRFPNATGALVLAAVGALCLHGGHLQLVYYALWFLAAYALIALCRHCGANSYREMRCLAWWLVVSGVLAVGIASYLLVPLVAEVPLLTRGVASSEFLRGGHAPSWQNLLTFLHPEVLGNPLDETYHGVELWEDVAYFGFIPFVLALVGGTVGWRRANARFLVVSFAVSLLLSLDTPFASLMYDILPGFRLFRLPRRLLFLTSYFGIALAGIGLEEILARLRNFRWAPARTAITVGAMILTIAGEGTYYAHRYLVPVDAKHVWPSTEYGRFLAGDPEVFRVAPFGSRAVTYGWAAHLGLELISGYEPFALRHYQRFIQLMQFQDGALNDAVTRMDFMRVPRWDFLSALNVKYALAPGPIQPQPRDFEVVAVFQREPLFIPFRGLYRTNVVIYRNVKAMPRAYWATNVVAAVGEDDAAALIQQHDLSHTAVVSDLQAEDGSPAVTPAGPAKVVAASGGMLEIDTDNPTRCFLVISEVWHPGWRITLDGVAQRLYRTDLALMGTWVPAGKHKLVLRFRPLYWIPALAVSLGSPLLGAGGMAAASLPAGWLKAIPCCAGDAPDRTS
jgi:hypothetical protein